MQKQLVIMAILLFCCSAFTVKEWPDELLDKFHNAIETTYNVQEYQATELAVSKEINNKLPAKVEKENLFEITAKESVLGYAYLGEAPSKKDTFDYVVFFTPDLIIKKSKVLIYREEFGRQIGTQRWLKQFIGMSAETTVEYGKNVAAISGATISASSMTRAVNNVLQTMRILKNENIL